MKFRSSCALLATLLPAFAAPSGPNLRLSPETLERLGIVFVPVGPASAGTGPIFPGTVVASPEIPSSLAAPFPGRIESWLADPGTAVRAGSPIAMLHSPEALAAQQAWLAAAAAHDAARLNLEKADRLLAEGIVSTRRHAQAVRELAHATTLLQAAAAPLHHAGFDAARLAALRTRGDHLGRCWLLAPGDGLVTRRLRLTGETVGPDTPLAEFRAAGPCWVRFRIPAPFVAGLAPGRTLRLSDGGPALAVRQIERSLDPARQSLGVLAAFVEESDHLPGQIVAVELPPPADAPRVPSSAVVHDGAATSVFIRSADGVEIRPVTLRPLGTDYLALSGLRAGEPIAVRGAAVLKGIQAGFGHHE